MLHQFDMQCVKPDSIGHQAGTMPICRNPWLSGGKNDTLLQSQDQPAVTVAKNSSAMEREEMQFSILYSG